MNQIVDKDGFIITKTISDPHHGSINEWGFYNGNLYHRTKGTKTWTKTNKVSFTPERFKAINKLI
jgi:hypothetical protein